MRFSRSAVKVSGFVQFAHPIFVTRAPSGCATQSLMANSAQAKKRAHQSAAQNAHNSSLRSAFRTAIKAVRKAIAAGDVAAATEQYRKSTGIIDRIADKKIVHKNKAARHKSRLAAAVKALGA